MKNMVKAGQAWNHGTVKGRVVHAVPTDFPEYSASPDFTPALCGARPVGRSFGWTEVKDAFTCQKCLSQLARVGEGHWG